MNFKLYLTGFGLTFTAITLAGCSACEPKPVTLESPFLEVIRPFDMGPSPKGISVRKSFTFKNGGGTRLIIDDFSFQPDENVFYLGISELPLTIAIGASVDLPVTFRPAAETAYSSDLNIDFNHGDDTPTPIPVKGKGISNILCLPCSPPPEPECGLDGEVSVYYETTNATDCESEEGICTYMILEMPCDNGLCNEATGLCPSSDNPAADAGTAPSQPTDAGQAVVLVPDAGASPPSATDAGQAVVLVQDAGASPLSPTDAGQAAVLVPDAGASPPSPTDAGTPFIDSGVSVLDNDNDGIPNDDDEYPEHHNGDLQFIIDLIDNSEVFRAPLELGGEQIWENGRLVHADFRLCNLKGPIPESIQNATQLRYLNLAMNNLSGEIPVQIGAAPLLETLYLSMNAFSGALPAELYTLTNLVDLDLGYNHNLGGSISEAIGNLVLLQSLGLGHAQFTGTLPDTLLNLADLSYLDVSYNRLSGEPFEVLNLLSQPTYLLFERNEFTGQLPLSLCESPDLVMSFQNNYFCGPYPDCVIANSALGDQNTSGCPCDEAEGVCLQGQECGIFSAGCDRLSVCPLIHSGVCECLDGYNTFDGGAECDLVPCPANAAGAPLCVCANDDDYYGGLYFDPETRQWTEECQYDPCAMVLCPNGTTCIPLPKGQDGGTARYRCE